jgi:hypothetical protein
MFRQHRGHLLRAAFAAVGVAVFVYCECDPGLRVLSAQTYSSGQNISPAYEGWEKNPDGSFNFLFGYMNRNWLEEIDVPIGPENNIQPTGPDRGQPTHFLPRRNRFIFRVRVPADWGEKEMVWTLATKGKIEKAYATLRPDYFVDDMVMASETGALGAGTSNPEVRANKRPTVRVEGEMKRTARVGQPITLTTVVTDDGVPRRRGGGGGGGQPAGAGARGRGRGDGGRGADAAVSPVPAPPAAAGAAAPGSAASRIPGLSPPSRVTVGKVTGLHLAWFVYRGSAKVTFDPIQIKTWEDTRAGANSPWAPLWAPPPVPPDGKYIVDATFEEPGTYVLRARADDGAALGDQEITVVVTR